MSDLHEIIPNRWVGWLLVAEIAKDFVNRRHYRVEKNKGCDFHPTRDNCKPLALMELGSSVACQRWSSIEIQFWACGFAKPKFLAVFPWDIPCCSEAVIPSVSKWELDTMPSGNSSRPTTVCSLHIFYTHIQFDNRQFCHHNTTVQHLQCSSELCFWVICLVVEILHCQWRKYGFKSNHHHFTVITYDYWKQ